MSSGRPASTNGGNAASFAKPFDVTSYLRPTFSVSASADLPVVLHPQGQAVLIEVDVEIADADGDTPNVSIQGVEVPGIGVVPSRQDRRQIRWRRHSGRIDDHVGVAAVLRQLVIEEILAAHLQVVPAATLEREREVIAEVVHFLKARPRMVCVAGNLEALEANPRSSEPICHRRLEVRDPSSSGSSSTAETSRTHL